MDQLAYVGCDRGKQTSVYTDMSSCAGDVGGKKTFVCTIRSVQATTEKWKCLLGRVSLCKL